MPSTPLLPKPPGTRMASAWHSRAQACLYASGCSFLPSSSSSAASTHSISNLLLHFKQACCSPARPASAVPAAAPQKGQHLAGLLHVCVLSEAFDACSSGAWIIIVRRYGPVGVTAKIMLCHKEPSWEALHVRLVMLVIMLPVGRPPMMSILELVLESGHTD